MLRWTLHQRGGGQAFHACVVVQHQVYCFGGMSDRSSKYQMNVCVFDTVSLFWTDLPPVTTGRNGRPPEVPYLCRGFTAVLVEDVIYIWGGYLGGWDNLGYYRKLLYAFNVSTHGWLKCEVTGTVPKGRHSHSACVLGKVMYVLGGHSKAGPAHDMYKLDTSTMVWSLIIIGGTPPKFCHQYPPYTMKQISATIIGTKMFVLASEVNPYCIRVFDTETNCWLSKPPVEPLTKGCHSAFAYHRALYILGGCEDDETYCIKKVEKVKNEGKGPSPDMYGGAVRFCVGGDRIILFGKHGAFNDLYILDLSPRLKTLCKLAVVQYGLEQSQLPHNSRWELAAMTANNKRKRENC